MKVERRNAELPVRAWRATAGGAATETDQPEYGKCQIYEDELRHKITSAVLAIMKVRVQLGGREQVPVDIGCRP